MFWYATYGSSCINNIIIPRSQVKFNCTTQLSTKEEVDIEKKVHLESITHHGINKFVSSYLHLVITFSLKPLQYIGVNNLTKDLGILIKLLMLLEI